MKTSELYTSAPVRSVLGRALRPGGEALTRQMLRLVAPMPGSMVVDAGCGSGATLKMLQDYGVQAVGLDLSAGFVAQARRDGRIVARADLALMPFADASLDLIVCECAWNLTRKAQTLAEFFRVLRPGGRLALADIYARGYRAGQWPVRCCFAQATDMQTVLEQVSGAGFAIDVVEDHTALLKKTAADFVFRYGSLRGFWEAVTGDAALAMAACAASTAAKPGLFVLAAHVG